jgi:NAD(P)H-hydrate epimerase
MQIPAITGDQMREVDRIMTDVYSIELLQMMESAGRHLASLARQRFLGNDPVGKHVVVLAGSGGNGGGGLVASRYLHNWGAQILIFTTKLPVDLVGVPGLQLCTLNQMNVVAYYAGELEGLPEADLIIDAIIGYSLGGVPRYPVATLIRQANENNAPILSLDIPSGIDATTGEAFVPHIKADATLTLALPKTGLLVEPGKSSVGELYLADISVPPELYEKIGMQLGPIFAEQDVIRI